MIYSREMGKMQKILLILMTLKGIDFSFRIYESIPLSTTSICLLAL